MTTTDPRQTLGLALAAFVEDQVAASREGNEPPTIRLDGFLEEEIAPIVRALASSDKLTMPGHDEPPTIVVGRRGELPGVPAEFLLSDDRTLTWYRNHNEHGLVILELDPQSDEQGLSFIDTLADNDVLRTSEFRDRRLRTITALSWRGRDPSLPEVPEVIQSEILGLFQHLIQWSIPPLRRWVTFVDQVTATLAGPQRAIAGPEVRSVLAASLPRLRLFPDDQLFERAASVERRLERNFHLAGLRTPQGRDVRTEDLEIRIDTVELRAADETPIVEPELSELRNSMHAVVDGGAVEALARVQLRYWEQLFERREPAIGLGAQIRAFLVDAHPTRVAEFDGLAVEAGLDDADADAAETLLRAEVAGSDVPLADVLRSDLRRRVERLVFSGEQESEDPLRTILYGINAIDFDLLPSNDPDADRRRIVLEWERLHDVGELSARLFGFLYGPTLTQVSTESAEGLGLQLSVDPELCRAGPLRLDRRAGGAPGEEAEAEDDEQDELTRNWAPLRLAIRLEGGGTPLLRFRWSPTEHSGLVAFARIVEAGGVDAGGRVPSLEGLGEAAMNAHDAWRIASADSIEPVDSLSSSWREEFIERAGEWTRVGLSVEGLDEFLGPWTTLLEQARDVLVPQGAPLAELDRFLGQDLVQTEAGSWVLLGSHPLRLRWVREHLHNMRSLLRRALEGELSLNPENDGLFFEWVNRVSPHRQPAILSPDDRTLATAAREVDWHEEFLPLDPERASAKTSVLDESSVEELVRSCVQFLHAYPHKRDGLSVLLLLRGHDASTPGRLLEKLRQKEFAQLVLTLHVVAPREDHERVARALAPYDDDKGRGLAMFPRLQLVLHSWDADMQVSLAELEGQIDIALAPNLFGINVDPLAETRARSEGVSGRFDSWLDPATHVRAGGGVNVSQVMLPAAPDPVLEAWSTLTVRRHRRSVVKHDDPSSTDFVTLQILFDANRALFERLHDVAHWVVTLDPFVGRDQIDALEHRPDIILVREGVGKNEIYTLVISSSAGRPFVTERLRRRLSGDLDFLAHEADTIADRLYDVGRNVCPGLMLRALGLGRSTEEILGLITARYVAAQRPEPPGDGVEFWISLDEHAHWFGGAHRTRPDMVRIGLTQGPSGARLDVLVVESKFRKAFDLSIADKQLDAGIRLLTAAFVTTTADESADARFWRRELHRALRQLSRVASDEEDLPAVRVLGRGLSDEEVDDLLLRGDFECETVEGLAVAAAWDRQTVAETTHTPGGHDLVLLGRASIREILLRLHEHQRPTYTESPAPTAPLPSSHVPPDLAPFRSATADRPSEEPRAGLGMTGRNAQYQRLLDRLDRLGVSVSPADPPHQEGPRFAVYRVIPSPDTPIDRVVGRTQELKLALGLAADQYVRAFVDRGAVVFEVPKDDEHSFLVSAEELWQRGGETADALAVPIGVDIEDGIVDIDFSSAETPHLLIAGQTGSGKSVALETLLGGLCHRKSPDELRLHLIDPKGTELLDLADDPHVEGEIGYLPEEALLVLRAGVEEMNRRYTIFRTHRARSLPAFNSGVNESERLPWWLIVLDEYADLTSDPDDRRAIELELRRIAQKGRAAGIHLVVATQRPSADVIGTVIRSNLPAQLALRVKSGTDSRLIIDEAGAETLAGKGDAFLRTAKGLTRLQCALVTS